jgi:hypothetical protein
MALPRRPERASFAGPSPSRDRDAAPLLSLLNHHPHDIAPRQKRTMRHKGVIVNYFS